MPLIPVSEHPDVDPNEPSPPPLVLPADPPQPASAEPIWDPDRDGKPGISWPAATILIVSIVAVAFLASTGALDLGDLVAGLLGVLGGAGGARLRGARP
jgi:hypothetical protein